MAVDTTKWPEAKIYFDLCPDGFFDELSDVQLFYTRTEVRESRDGSKLYIGRPGVDGIEFVYRKDAPGLWAWYPLEGRMAKLAETFPELRDGWQTGKITV